MRSSSQCRTYGYNIHAMSEAEDLVVVEDMATQPRVLAERTAVEYGPVYEMLHAIVHGKPLVAVTLADGDYHTPPNLMRLAMAEAAAHGASYLSWPTWPDAQREHMTAAVRPMADFLRRARGLLNGAKTRCGWSLASCRSAVGGHADIVRAPRRTHAAANVQFRVERSDAPKTINLQSIKRSVTLPDGPATVRASSARRIARPSCIC